MTPEKRPAETEADEVVSKKPREELSEVPVVQKKNGAVDEIDDVTEEEQEEKSENGSAEKAVEEDDDEEPENENGSADKGDNVPEGVLDESSQDSVASSASAGDQKKRLSLPEGAGKLVFCGCHQWEVIGRRNVKPNLAKHQYAPRIMKSFADQKVAFVASHSSAAHAVIITAEGKTYTMGRNEKGQLGLGDAEIHDGPTLVDSLSDIVVVSAAVGKHHSLFLTDRGTVFACGENKSGQLGTGNASPMVQTPCRISFKGNRIVKVACGAEFSVILDNKGSLYTFGLPEYGQLGHNTDGKFFLTSNKLSYQFETTPRKVPIYVERSKDGHPTPVPDVDIVDVACGNNHVVALDSRKRAYSWGFGGYGRLGHNEPKDEMVPRLIKFFDGANRGVHKVYCGGSFSMATGIMGLYLWGQTKRTGEANMYPKPVQDLCGWEIHAIGCGTTSIVVGAESSVIAWGPSPTYGELGLGDNIKSSTTPKECKALEGANVTQVAVSYGFSLLIVKDDTEDDAKLIKTLKEVEL